MAMETEPATRARLMGYVRTGCIKCGGFTKKVMRHSNDCSFRKEVSRSTEKQQWRRAVS